jgi:predicted DsbA family dithiol-disulfide isomerase
MKVEIWSDIVCPWCYIGKRRFEAAMARFAHRGDVEVIWRAFELDPTAAAAPEGDLAERLASKYGTTIERARAMQANMTQVAAQDGLDFRFDIARSGNTFDAHRLLHLAAEHGVQDDLKERYFKAYLTDGQPIGDRETLVRVAAEAGLDAATAREVVESDAYARDVRAEERRASALGITGVPFFVIDEKYGLSGAQPADVLLDALEQAWEESHPAATLVVAGGAGNACVGDECPV